MSSVTVQKIAEPGEAPSPVLQEVDELFDQIRRKAFEIFEKNGSAHGHDVEHWLEAERECICCPESQLVYKDGQFEISVTTPGSEPKDLQVAVLPDSIVVKGQASSNDEKKQGDTHSSESSERVLFSRVTLPEPIDVNTASARLEKGVLHIVARKGQQTTQTAAA